MNGIVATIYPPANPRCLSTLEQEAVAQLLIEVFRRWPSVN